MKKTDFKVGDFVYCTDCSEDDECYGVYGIIQEIKDITKAGKTFKAAVIKVKYFEDGTPCEWDSKKVIRFEMLDPAQTAIERHERELQRQLDNMKNIRKDM